MRFMAMHKINDHTEQGKAPTQELIAGMGKLTEDGLEAGVFVSTAGLKPTRDRARLRAVGSQRTITRGPFRGQNELIAGFILIKVRGMEEALSWASRLADVMGDVEIEIGPVCEPWDIGMAPKPEGEVPVRFMLMNKADKSTEAGTPPTRKRMAAMGALIDSMVNAGVFLAAEGLHRTAKGARFLVHGGKRKVIDGPFAESKEMIAGYCILQVNSKEEAIYWVGRFTDVVGDADVDILQMVEPSDFAALEEKSAHV